MSEVKKAKNGALSLCFGVAISVIITIALIFAIACICYFADVSERMIGIMLFSASAISVFLGGMLVSAKQKRAGLFFGAVTGLAYFAVIFAASVCISGVFSPSAQSITMLFGSLFSGALGGVVGVNRR